VQFGLYETGFLLPLLQRVAQAFAGVGILGDAENTDGRVEPFAENASGYQSVEGSTSRVTDH
jgi:hypothetical protein